ncbi:MAG: flagellar hook-associated protein FlgK [Sulfitobacter geojensis]
MSLTGALNSASSGLRTTQTLSSVAADNVANALTPGYTRRTASVISTASGADGVTIADIRRDVDASLQRMSRLETGKMARYQALDEGLSRYTSYLGQPGDGTSPADKFSAFQNSFTTLVNMPSSHGAQAGVALAAEDLAQVMRGAATSLGTTLSEVDMEMRYEVADLNQALYQLQDLNAKQLSTVPGSANSADVSEQIDGLLDQISGIVDTRVSFSSSGTVSVYTIGGAALIEGQSVQDVTFNAGDGTLMAGQQDITPFKDGVRGLQHGSLVGLSELKGTIIPQFNSQLDEYARGLIQTFEAADASLAPGDAGLFTDNGMPFDPANLQGLASRLQVNEKVSMSGDAEVWRLRDGMSATTQGPAAETTQIASFIDGFATTMGASANTAIPSTVTLQDFAAEMVTNQATERVRAENSYFAARTSAEMANGTRANAEGVNIDDEMQRLLLIEQSYAANSRVLTTVSNMIDTLIAAV